MAFAPTTSELLLNVSSAIFSKGSLFSDGLGLTILELAPVLPLFGSVKPSLELDELVEEEVLSFTKAGVSDSVPFGSETVPISAEAKKG